MTDIADALLVIGAALLGSSGWLAWIGQAHKVALLTEQRDRMIGLVSELRRELAARGGQW